MIEIDDAGGGCFLGPEVLVIHRLETREVWYLLIPPQIEERVKYATKLLKRAFTELNISKEETVRLCRGEIFDPFQIYLEEKAFQVIREKVSHQTDALAEAKFLEILNSYGFPRELTLENRNYQAFYETVAYWYYSLNKKVGGIRKARLKPPFRAKRIAEKYPNLMRLLFHKDIAS